MTMPTPGSGCIGGNVVVSCGNSWVLSHTKPSRTLVVALILPGGTFYYYHPPSPSSHPLYPPTFLPPLKNCDTPTRLQ